MGKPLLLHGITVLDLTRAVAGPFCTMLLADLGARVIKVEEPGVGDETRHWGPPFIQGESAYFLGLNRGKESIEIDLKSDAGRDAILKLAERADVLIQNFRPGVAEKLGFDYETLQSRNQRLIYASISGFGQTGPDSGKPGYDLIVQALTGLLLASAPPGGQPVKPAIPIADVLAAHFTCQAILAALFDRERSGAGRRVEVSLLEALLASMVPIANTYLLAGVEPSPEAPTHSHIVPYQIFRCQDSHIVVAVPNERIWRRFCRAVDRPGWLEDDRYVTNGNRARHRGQILPEMEELFRGKPASEWLHALDKHQVPCAPILTVGQLFREPHVIERQTAIEVEHPELGPIQLVASPIRFDEARSPYRPPPRLGEHTAEVLEEIGRPDRIPLIPR